MLRRAHAEVKDLWALFQMGPFIDTVRVSSPAGDRLFKRVAIGDMAGPFSEWDQDPAKMAVISPLSSVDMRVIVEKGARIEGGAEIGPYTFVGRCAAVLAGAKLEGGNELKELSTVGEGAVLAEGVRLEKCAAVSSGDTRGPDEVVYTYGLASSYPFTL